MTTEPYIIPAPEDPEEQQTTGRQFLDGADFIFNVPAIPPAVWGAGQEVLWAEGEALILYGGSGVGKSTIAGQLVRALILNDGHVLGYPVSPASGNVLYLAMDRPRQIARSLSRQFHPAHRDQVGRKLLVWPGPPPADMARNELLLAQMCREAGASHVIVDSLKDAAIGLSEDAVGAGYNRARQAALRDGVQVLELHHQIKRRGGDAPKGIDAVYGSTWIAAGAGSVIYLEGDPGDAVVKFRHLKQPADTVGPFDVLHDQDTGLSTVMDDRDPIQIIRSNGGTLSAPEYARVLYQADIPKKNDIEKARRKLNGMVKDGRLSSTPTVLDNGSAGPTVYTLPEAA